ncbi:hypothetical protein GQ457_01G008140 [Hibiscus cannabinus]
MVHTNSTKRVKTQQGFKTHHSIQKPKPQIRIKTLKRLTNTRTEGKNDGQRRRKKNKRRSRGLRQWNSRTAAENGTARGGLCSHEDEELVGRGGVAHEPTEHGSRSFVGDVRVMGEGDFGSDREIGEWLQSSKTRLGFMGCKV